MAFSPLPPEHRKELAATLFTAAFVIWLMAQPGFGFMAALLVCMLAFAIPWRTYQAMRVPAARRLHVARIGIWVAALAFILAVHYARTETARHNADEVLARLNEFSARHGRCAANIGEIGLTQKALTDKIGAWSYYACRHGKRKFLYRATFLYIAIYRYDFASRAWQYLPDGLPTFALFSLSQP